MARLPGGERIAAGPSFEDHLALLQEHQKLQEKCEEEKVALHTLEGLVTWCTLHLQNAESSAQFAVLLQETERKRAVISTMVSKMDYTGAQWFTCTMFRSSRLATLPGECKGNLRRRMVLLCVLWILLWRAFMSHARRTMEGPLLETMSIDV